MMTTRKNLAVEVRNNWLAYFKIIGCELLMELDRTLLLLIYRELLH